MIKIFALWMASLVVVVALIASALTTAQGNREPRILSGQDIGFRVDRMDHQGHPLGRLMVRVDGRWVEAGFAGSVTPLR